MEDELKNFKIEDNLKNVRMQKKQPIIQPNTLPYI